MFPFWARAAATGAVVFLHPMGCTLEERLDRCYLSNTVGQPVENAVTLSHLVFSGVLDRHPDPRVVAAHGGGYLPTFLGRSDHAWQVRPEARECAEPPSSHLRRLWFDSLVHSPEALRALVTRRSPDLPTVRAMSTGPCSTACTADVVPTAPVAVRRRRALALTGALARASARPPVGDGRRHGVCTAARLLTAVGVRVRVVPPTVQWPRGPRLVVANRVSWVDELALRTAVAALPAEDVAGWPGLATVRTDRVTAELTAGRSVLVRPEEDATCGTGLGRSCSAAVAPALAAGAPVCPVAVRFRLADRPTTAAAHAGDESWWRSAARVLSSRELVVELHRLRAIDPRPGSAAEVAALAEYAIAAVLETDPPRPVSHPHRARTHVADVASALPDGDLSPRSASRR